MSETYLHAASGSLEFGVDVTLLASRRNLRSPDKHMVLW
jgi:hypothetical protein